jgi:outer membrane protein assembly factor BamB
MVRIVQTPQLIVMLNPDLTYRQIWMDGRKLEADPNVSWMGYSVGRWEGETLVVESFGFHTGTWLDRDGNTHSEKLRLTERYRRPIFGSLEVEVTLADPEAAMANGRVILGGRDKSIHAIDVKTGKAAWTFATRARVDSSPVIVGGRVYVGSSDGRLYVLDADSGKQLWEFDAGSALTASPAVAAGRLVIGSQDGRVYVLG